MKNGVIVKIALRNLRQHSLRTLLTVAGFAIGTAAIIFLLGFSYGLERLVVLQVSAEDAFLMLDVAPVSQELTPLNGDALQKISRIGGVANIEPAVDLSARARGDGEKIDAVLTGTTQKYLSWFNVDVVDGKGILARDAVLVNQTLERKLAAEGKSVVGSQITLDVVVPRELAADGVAATAEDKRFLIAGVVRDEAPPRIYLATRGTTELGAVNYTRFRVMVSEKEDIPSVRNLIGNMGYKTDYIGDTVAQINEVFRIFKSILGSFGAIALAVAVLGMFNTLTISLMERMREIALMKVLGIKPWAVVKLVTAEALLVGLMGTISGVVLGIAGGLVTDRILMSYAESFGGGSVSVFYFPVPLLLLAILAAVLISVVTAALPIRRALKVEPLDVFRYE